MTGAGLIEALQAFASAHRVRDKGWLCVALVVTDHARTRGLPLDPSALRTDGGGQVLGLGKSAVQSILKRHGETRVLAQEGGRTSRGSIGNMEAYVAFLNALPAPVELDAVEAFWIERVREFFAGKPFKLRFDRSASLRSVVRNLLDDAARRQREGSGTQYVGAVAQHLVGAKLICLFGDNAVKAEAFSTADEPGGRAGDFEFGDAAIHVTATPTEALIAKCGDNIARGLRPVVVTIKKNVAVAEGLAENAGLGGRIDVLDIEQFIATNLFEHGQFALKGAEAELTKLVDAYNRLVDAVETDPSLRIERG